MTSFKKEYNKMQNAIKKFHDEYMSLINVTNIKTMYELLLEQSILSDNNVKHFNDLFHMFLLNPNVTNDTQVPHVPYINDKKIKLKKNQLSRFIHPDKILQIYGTSIFNEYQDYFSELFKYLYKDSNTCLNTLEHVFTNNKTIFQLLIDKLTEKNLISNNEIKSIKQNAMNKIYNTNHTIQLPKVYSMFPLEINLFVTQYNILNNYTVEQRWFYDINILLRSVINNIYDNINDSLWIPNVNIMEIFKRNNMHQQVNILLIVKTYLKNCYKYIISMFVVHETLKYIKRPLILSTSDDLKENILLDMIECISNPVSKHTMESIIEEENKTKS